MDTRHNNIIRVVTVSGISKRAPRPPLHHRTTVLATHAVPSNERVPQPAVPLVRGDLVGGEYGRDNEPRPPAIALHGRHGNGSNRPRGGTSAGNQWYSRTSKAGGRAQYFSFAVILIILSYAVYYYYRICDRRRVKRGPNLHRRGRLPRLPFVVIA